MNIAGHALNSVPEALGIHDPDERTCCAAASCFGLCYAVDLCCAIPTMSANEVGFNKFSLPLFAFYECCWPCMRALECVGVTAERRRDLRGNVWPPPMFDPHT